MKPRKIGRLVGFVPVLLSLLAGCDEGSGQARSASNSAVDETSTKPASPIPTDPPQKDGPKAP